MKIKKFRNVLFFLSILLALATTVAVLASDVQNKDYNEGSGGIASKVYGNGISAERLLQEGEYGASGKLISSNISQDSVDKIEAGGSGGYSVQDSNLQRSYPEGEAGLYSIPDQPIIQADLSVRYMFSGVTDDGEQGSGNRREATSILCTNTGLVNNQIYVELYQWNGTDIFTGTVNAPPLRSFTFSTQNTTIYFDDVIIGGVPGTDAIFQGYGRILSEKPSIVCAVEVLDPLGYPPIFVSSVELYKP